MTVQFKCYDCGNEKGCFESVDVTNYMESSFPEYNFYCPNCGSENCFTDEEGEPFREINCPICHATDEELIPINPECQWCEGYGEMHPYQEDSVIRYVNATTPEFYKGSL